MCVGRRLARATLVLAALAGAGCDLFAAERGTRDEIPTALPPAPSPPDEAPRTVELHVGPDGALEAQSFDGVTRAEVEASTRRRECAGWVGDQPALVLTLDGPVDPVRFRVEPRGSAALDAVLVVERADGRVLCNDDGDGFLPVLATALPAGVHRVWVGTWDRHDAGARFTLHLDREVPEGTPRGEPTVDRLNAVCDENWCADGTAWRFEHVECGAPEGCRVEVTLAGERREVVVPGTRASWGEDGLDERFVEGLTAALGSVGER